MITVTSTTVRKALSVKVIRPYSTLFGGGVKENHVNGNNDSLISNAPRWNHENATESEADVKADRDPDNISNIEKKSTEYFKKKAQK